MSADAAAYLHHHHHHHQDTDSPPPAVPPSKQTRSRRMGKSRSNPPGHVIDNMEVIKKEVSDVSER